MGKKQHTVFARGLSRPNAMAENVKLYFDEIEPKDDDEDGPTIVYEGDVPADESIFESGNAKGKKKKGG